MQYKNGTVGQTKEVGELILGETLDNRDGRANEGGWHTAPGPSCPLGVESDVGHEGTIEEPHRCHRPWRQALPL